MLLGEASGDFDDEALRPVDGEPIGLAEGVLLGKADGGSEGLGNN